MNDEPEVRQPYGFASPWARSDRPVARRVVRPLEQFVSQEAGSGAILLVAAIAALVWANAAPASYEGFWHLSPLATVGWPLPSDTPSCASSTRRSSVVALLAGGMIKG
jgi:hypothetical protein